VENGVRDDKQCDRESVPVIRDLTITMRRPTALQLLGRATRQHPKEQLKKIAEIVRTNGIVLPVLIDSQDRVVAGWGLVLVAKELGLQEIPVVCNSDLSETQLRALRIALNKVAELSSWDNGELKLEIEEILQIDPGLPLAIDTPRST
jgi:ParB-like chromosome segregation protein Spo0J